eukprot:5443893-Pleurochrysis_carterae.AAC.1
MLYSSISNKECWKDAKRKWEQEAGGRKDCKCGIISGKGSQTGRTRKRSGGENRIWWRTRPEGTKYTGPRHASTSSARGGDH